MKGAVHGTTIICVRRDGRTVMGGDGQVTVGDTSLKHTARKVRKLYGGKIVTGFAGSTADAFTLFDRFEEKLQEYRGNLRRAAVELVRQWRTDRILRRLEAMLIVADVEAMFLLSGSGDLIEPDGDVLAIGSGGPYAQSAARALLGHTELDARRIVEEALRIAADMCIYTNDTFVIEELHAGEVK